MNKKFVAKIAATAMAFALAATSVVGDCSMASAAVRTVTVSTQKQLNRALKNNKVKSIVIKTDKPVKFTIGATSYAKKSLTVNAPEATVNNRGDFKKITVQDGKKFTDHGEGNQITISDPNSLKFVAGKNAEVASVTVTSKEGKISIGGKGSVSAVNVEDAATLAVKAGTMLEAVTVKADATIEVAAGAHVGNVQVADGAEKVALQVNGTVGAVNIDAKAELSISGSTTDAMKITNNAQGANVTASVKVELTLNADAKITLDAGAEGSSVEVTKADIKPAIENKTKSDVTVKDSAGKSDIVKPGEEKTSDSTTGGGSTGGGGSTSGGSSSGGGSSSSSESESFSVKLSWTGDMIKTGTVLTADVSGAGGSDVTYEWCYGNKPWFVGENAKTYTVTDEQGGWEVGVKVTATINGKECTAWAWTNKEVQKRIAEVQENFAPLIVANGASNDAVIEALKYSRRWVSVRNEYDWYGEIPVNWTALDGYNGAAGTYTFKGTIDAPERWYFDDSVSREVTCEVLVQPKNALNLTFKEEDGSEYPLTQDGNYLIVTGDALNVASAGALSYSINVSEADSTLQYAVGSSGGTYDNVENDAITVNLYDLLDGSQTYYFKTDANDATPYVIIFDWSYVSITDCMTSYDRTVTKEYREDKVYPDNMPKTLTFKDKDGKTYDLVVTWPDDAYTGDAGTWYFDPEITLWKYLDYSSALYDSLRITLTVEKAEQAEPVMNDPKIIPDMSKGTITVSHSAIKAYVNDANAGHDFFITTSDTEPDKDVEDYYCPDWDGEMIFGMKYEDGTNDGFSIAYDKTYTIYVRAAERDNYNASDWKWLGVVTIPPEGTGE